jgi:hypothetical protein
MSLLGETTYRGLWYPNEGKLSNQLLHQLVMEANDERADIINIEFQRLTHRSSDASSSTHIRRLPCGTMLHYH